MSEYNESIRGIWRFILLAPKAVTMSLEPWSTDLGSAEESDRAEAIEEQTTVEKDNFILL